MATVVHELSIGIVVAPVGTAANVEIKRFYAALSAKSCVIVKSRALSVPEAVVTSI